MRQLSLTLLFSVYSIFLSSQNCLPEGIKFLRQSQVDSFSILYPGCTVIEGDVGIGNPQSQNSSDITHLDSLMQLTSIKGKLTITRNSLLTNLEGLNNLIVLEDDVEISWNEGLTSLHGIDQVRMMKGSFNVFYNYNLETISGFDLLDTIFGTLSLSYMNKIESVDAFSNLKYLGGYRLTNLENLLTIQDMNRLEYLGGFRVENNDLLSALPKFPLITVVHGDFEVSSNWVLPEVVGYENINRVTGNLSIESALQELNGEPNPFLLDAFHNVTFVGGNCGVHLIGQKDTLDGFTSLDSIGGSLVVGTSSVFNNFPQNNQFKYIGGDIGFTNLTNLENLACINELERINGGLALSYCPNLLSLSAISHYTEFGGRLSISYMNFTNLTDLANLTSIGGGLSIYNCNSLTNLSGLESLTSIDGPIFIYRNLNLESLEGIRNIDPQTIANVNGAIIITDNTRLETCNVTSICEALRGLRRSHHISGNAPGCKDVTQIVCEDYGPSGIVFFDVNENQVKDATEIGIPGIPIRIQPGDLISPSNAEGQFFVYADSGDVYTMMIEQSPDWILTTDSISYTRIFEEGAPGDVDHMFGLIPANDWYDLSVDLISNPIRCNQWVTFFLHWLNGSTRSVNGRITLQYDPKVIFVNSEIPPSMHNNVTHELSWNIDSLSAFTGQHVRLAFKMPNFNFVGQTMEFTARSFIDTSGTQVQMDVVEYDPIVECAVTPNDKLVLPPGLQDENYTPKDDFLTYTIRFANPGNAEAIDITIVDTLDALFDMNSFRVVNSSFPVFTMIDGRIVTFLFKNIWLWEQGTGFVTFEIKPRSDLPDLTTVENFAGIVFDFDQPIFTNTTMNTLVEEVCETVVVGIDMMICDGGQFMGLTETGIYIDTVHISSYCDSVTVINLQVVDTVILGIDTAICAGESFLGFDTTGLFTFDSINMVTGCTDVVELNLVVIPLYMSPCITGTNDIEEAGIKVYPNPAQHEIFIEASMPIESVRLIAADGRSIFFKEMSLKESETKLQLPGGTEDGFYILAIGIEGSLYYKKLVVGR